MLLLKCKECGNMKETKIEIFHNYCYTCKALDSMVIIDNTEKDNIIPQVLENQEESNKKIVDYICITKMEVNIKELGHKKCRDIIERMKNGKTRYAYRKIFFEAGGKYE